MICLALFAYFCFGKYSKKIARDKSMFLLVLFEYFNFAGARQNIKIEMGVITRYMLLFSYLNTFVLTGAKQNCKKEIIVATRGIHASSSPCLHTFVSASA